MLLKTIKIKGNKFNIYEKSIKIDSVGRVFWYNRPVTEEDAQQLADLIERGRNEGKSKLQDEIKRLLDI